MNSRLQKAHQLMTTGGFDEAERLCRSSIKLGKDVLAARQLLATCLYNRSAMLLRHPELFPDAESLLRECLQFAPDFSLALNNLGSLLLVTQRAEEACRVLTRLAQLHDADIQVLENLASAQQEAGFFGEASATLLRLAELNPQENAAYLLRDALLAPAVPDSVEDVSRIRVRALEKLRSLALRDNLRVTDPLHFPATYFRFTYHGESNTELNQLIAKVYSKANHGLSWTAPHISTWKYPHGRRIRIGIASRFLRSHSIGNTSRGFVEMLDRHGFEIVVIRLEPSPNDDVAKGIDACADRVCELRTGVLADAREEIAKMELDILFYQDIGMEPFSYFLAFSRLAPVQLTSFGHPDTTGISNLDYFVSSEWYEQADSASNYTESLVCLPRAGTLSYYHRPGPAPVSDRASYGLPLEGKIYCCPQTLFKVQPIMDRLFSGIVENDPGACIVLIEPAEKHWRMALEARFAKNSSSLSKHICFLPTMHYEKFLGLLALADVVLDTVPFNGQNTTLESFAVGVPVVTLAGNRQCERHGYGLYRAIGYMDLVAESEADYIEKAIRVANDPLFRSACSSRIAEGAGGLFEDEGVIRNFEAEFRRMLSEADQRWGSTLTV